MDKRRKGIWNYLVYALKLNQIILYCFRNNTIKDTAFKMVSNCITARLCPYFLKERNQIPWLSDNLHFKGSPD